MKNKPILICDSREKSPWIWDDDEAFDHVEYRKLNTGDYSILGLEDVITIERKSSADELLNNFFSKREKTRIFAEFERMQEYPHRFIIVEQDLETIMTPNSYFAIKKKRTSRSPKQIIAIVMDNLVQAMLDYNIHVIFAGDKAQSIARSLLLKAYDAYVQ